MVKLDQSGVAGAVVSLVLCVILLLAAIGFGAWAFSSRQDYKNNTDAKISAAVIVAKQQEDAVNAKQYAEAAKNPLVTYNGPETYGSIVLEYPKTWSGYVDSTGNGNALVDGYFSPGVVPAINSQTSVFALRMQVINQSYSQTLQSLQGQTQNGQATVVAYSLPKLPKVVGVEVTGELQSNQSATTTMVVLPLRSQTLEISTQGTQYLSDFNTYVLPNFSFSP